MAGPATQDHAFVLHTRRYRENSLLLEALTREHGRVGLVARVGSLCRTPAASGGLLRRLDDLDIPGQHPEVRAALEAEPDTTALHARLRALDPVAAGRMEPTNRRRIVRALEVTLGSGRPFSSFGPGVHAHPSTAFTMVGLGMEQAVLAERIATRYEAQLAAGFLDEVRGLVGHPRGLSRTARQALGYKELIDHLEGLLSLEEAVDLAVRRTRRFARRQRAWFRRDPRITWLGATHRPRALVDALAARSS